MRVKRSILILEYLLARELNRCFALVLRLCCGISLRRSGEIDLRLLGLPHGASGHIFDGNCVSLGGEARISNISLLSVPEFHCVGRAPLGVAHTWALDSEIRKEDKRERKSGSLLWLG